MRQRLFYCYLRRRIFCVAQRLCRRPTARLCTAVPHQLGHRCVRQLSSHEPLSGAYRTTIDLVVTYWETGERQDLSFCETGTTDLEAGTLSW